MAQCANGQAQPACVNGAARCCTTPSQCEPVLCVFQNSGASCCNDFDCGFTSCDTAPTETACNDGQDNDGDGLTDYPADPGCTSTTDTSEAEDTSQCQNGRDDDGDGKVDYPSDPGCVSRLDNDESTASPTSSSSSSTASSVISSSATTSRSSSSTTSFSSVPSGGGSSSATAILILSVSDSRTTILPGERYTYGVTLTNAGQASSSVNVSLDLSGKLNVLSVSSAGSLSAASSSAGGMGSGRVMWSNVSVGANTSVILTAEVQAQSVIANGTVLQAKAQVTSASLTATDDTTVLVMTANDGCIDVIKETYDTNNAVLTPVTQFSFALSGGAATCGNGVINSGEQCDYASVCAGVANGQPCDCTATCQLCQAGQNCAFTWPANGAMTVQNDGGGRARFVPLTPGTYTVTETVPNTWSQISVTPANGSVTVTAGTQCAVVTFKNRQLIASSSSRSSSTSSGASSSSTTSSSNSSNSSQTSSPTSSSTSSFISSVANVPQCSDGLDNDGDGLVDSPADPGCAGVGGTDESSATTQCQNGVDDDNDGRVDMGDAGCKSAQDNSEVDTSVGTTQFCTVLGVFCDTQAGSTTDQGAQSQPTFTCQNTMQSGPQPGRTPPPPTCKQCACSSSSSRISVQSSTSRSSSTSSASSSNSSSTTSSNSSSNSSSTSSATSSSRSSNSSDSSSSSSSRTSSSSSRSSSSSSLPYCGDGRRDSGEQCGEPGLSCPSGQTCNLSSCLCSGGGFCGDGRIDSGEQCGEPGLTCSSGSTCDNRTCLCNRPQSYCGDGKADAGEQCGEPSLACGSGTVCNNSTCACVSQAVCGNGRQDQGEQCGEPGINCPAGQTCSTNTCQCTGTAPFCGNGQQDAGEQCGEPGLNCPSGQNCGTNCLCTGGVACGNGRVDAGEQCNEPGLSCPVGQTCGIANCLCSGGLACGNGRADRGEQCGEPGLTCGAGQECNTNNCLCTVPPITTFACGNGQLEPTEECDDGNTRDNDGCSARCFRERGTCGDGIVQTLLDEQCEPATFDRSLPYQCGQNCRFVSLFCGDGKRDAGEECDLGADNSNSPGATCRTDCSSARCGDQVVDPIERCDDGNRVDGDGCNRLCQTEAGAPLVKSSSSDGGPVMPFEPTGGRSLYSSVSSVFPFPTGKGLTDDMLQDALRVFDADGRFLGYRIEGNKVYDRNGRFMGYIGDDPTGLALYDENGKLIGYLHGGTQPPLGYIGNSKELSKNGPPIVAVIAAGAAAGAAWVRRRRDGSAAKKA